MEHGLVKNSNLSESASRIRVIVDEAVKEGEISHSDYDKIIEITGEDGHVDVHEQAILTELHQMIHDKELKFKKVVKHEAKGPQLTFEKVDPSNKTANETNAYIGMVHIGGYFKHFNRNGVDEYRVHSELPITFKRIHETEHEAIDELKESVEVFLGLLNKTK